MGIMELGDRILAAKLADASPLRTARMGNEGRNTRHLCFLVWVLLWQLLLDSLAAVSTYVIPQSRHSRRQLNAKRSGCWWDRLTMHLLLVLLVLTTC